MKILYHHRIASKDGQYVHVEELTKALRGLGHEIIMVCPESSNHSDFGSEGGLVPYLKKFIPGFIYELLELVYSIFAFFKLRKAFLKHSPDCLYERYNLYTPSGAWIRKLYGLPFLLEINAPIFDERRKYDGIALPWLARWSEIYVWKMADYVLPVTHVLAERIRQSGISTDRIIVIPNGIDHSKFGVVPDNVKAKTKLGMDGRLVLGFTGFVREWHGLDHVLELLASADQLKKWYLIVVGDGPALADLKNKAIELDISERVMFAGIVKRDSIPEYVAAFDIALQPDVVPYASPLKLFEYMAMGRAIVAPDTPNIRETLTDGENAMLFNVKKVNAFSDSVVRLCDDEMLRSRISISARETIFTNGYTWKANAMRVEALIRSKMDVISVV